MIEKNYQFCDLQRIKIQGNGKVNPGNVVALEGVGARFAGNVMAVAVRHEISKGNWYTDIQFGQSAEWYAAEMEIDDYDKTSPRKFALEKLKEYLSKYQPYSLLQPQITV